jgi:hypothetical protein
MTEDSSGLSSLVKGILVILIWVGIWGIVEMIIDAIAAENKMIRVMSHFVVFLIGVLFLWILDYSLEI